MTKNREPMPVHELCKFVSDRTDDYRVYDWREIEAMREDLARVSMGHSELAAKVNGLSNRLVMVHRVLAEMRDAKAYEWADKLRDALEGRS